MHGFVVVVVVVVQRHYRVRAAACLALATWQTRHAPKVNHSVVVSERYTWHALAVLVQQFKVRVGPCGFMRMKDWHAHTRLTS